MNLHLFHEDSVCAGLCLVNGIQRSDCERDGIQGSNVYIMDLTSVYIIVSSVYSMFIYKRIF